MPEIISRTLKLREAYADRMLVPWIGAGLSSAVSIKGQGDKADRLPGFEGILTFLTERAKHFGAIDEQQYDTVSKLIQEEDYSLAAKVLRPYLTPKQFTELMWEKLSTFRPLASQHHVMLNLMQFEVFLTTNYDWVLDDIVRPRPKVLSYQNLATLNALLDRDGKPPVQSPFIFKLNGDLSAPPTIVLGQAEKLGYADPDKPLGQALWQTLRKLMQRRSILFVGYSFEAAVLRNLLIELGKDLGDQCRPHFAVLPKQEWAKVEQRSELENHANVTFFPFELQKNTKDGDEYRELWQFLSQIPSERSRRAFKMTPGKVERTFFMLQDRPRYLEVQRRFEEDAQVFRFLTPNLSNAVATEEFVDKATPPTLIKFQGSREIADWNVWKDEVIHQMKLRVVNLRQRIETGAEARILCIKTDTLNSIAKADAVTLNRFRLVLHTIDDPRQDVQVRLLHDTEASRSLMSFASLLRSIDGGQTDVGVAYATQATSSDFNAHVFEMNTEFSRDMLVSFEREWARAIPLKESVDMIKGAVAEREQASS